MRLRCLPPCVWDTALTKRISELKQELRDARSRIVELEKQLVTTGRYIERQLVTTGRYIERIWQLEKYIIGMEGRLPEQLQPPQGPALDTDKAKAREGI